MNTVSNRKVVNYPFYIVIGLILIAAIVLVIGASFAFFSYSKEGATENKIVSGSLELTLNETSNGISLLNAQPVSSTVGLTYTPYQFTLQNKGTADLKYRLRLINDPSETTTLDTSYLMYNLKATDSGGSVVFNETKLLPESGILADTQMIAASETLTFELRLWLDRSAGNDQQGKVYYGKLSIDGALPTDSFPSL